MTIPEPFEAPEGTVPMLVDGQVVPTPIPLSEERKRINELFDRIDAVEKHLGLQ